MPTTPEEENYTRSTDTQSASAASAASAASQRSTIPTHATRIVTSFMATLDKDDSTSPYREEERILLRGQSRGNIRRDLFQAVSATLGSENSRLESMGKTAGSMDNVVFRPDTIKAVCVGDVLLVGNLHGEGWLGNASLSITPSRRSRRSSGGGGDFF
ncbi:hypothetical protein L198_05874 [Cryptococcus wingfieldii CBS 7118]|uniref:Uncharacterized protein n=1 Tax=Cryptococcus wingfieldii CBS 7118 TaxID=1295528 RepID=A0A1E3IRW3_9TREE|nr:hypothetical protein L198_05874 [Cryptococcus wingfieldii CBS 7118]ODN91363.1 hypothetical protein L198_05874 [Cryptococcus wingfieldii CBS 7118]